MMAMRHDAKSVRPKQKSLSDSGILWVAYVACSMTKQHVRIWRDRFQNDPPHITQHILLKLSGFMSGMHSPEVAVPQLLGDKCLSHACMVQNVRDTFIFAGVHLYLNAFDLYPSTNWDTACERRLWAPRNRWLIITLPAKNLHFMVLIGLLFLCEIWCLIIMELVSY